MPEFRTKDIEHGTLAEDLNKIPPVAAKMNYMSLAESGAKLSVEQIGPIIAN